jgi:hypothetical protein
MLPWHTTIIPPHACVECAELGVSKQLRLHSGAGNGAPSAASWSSWHGMRSCMWEWPHRRVCRSHIRWQEQKFTRAISNKLFALLEIFQEGDFWRSK